MKYPRWFPFPGCWIRALVTWLTANLIGLLLVVITPLAAGVSVPFLAIASGDNPIISGVAILIIVAVLFTALVLFPTFVYAHVRQVGEYFAGKQEAFPFIPTAANWRKAVGDELVVFLGALSVLPFVIPTPDHLVEEVIAICIPLAFIATAYCYHFRVLFHRHQERARKQENLNRNRQGLRRNKRVPTAIVDD
ncbi:hypothetical protein PJF56_10615, partial [Roseofilum sp. BLCC_M91]